MFLRDGVHCLAVAVYVIWASKPGARKVPIQGNLSYLYVKWTSFTLTYPDHRSLSGPMKVLYGLLGPKKGEKGRPMIVQMDVLVQN